jgi:hypothetical protein
MRILKLVVAGLAIFGAVSLAQRVRHRMLRGRAVGEPELPSEDPSITDADLVVIAVESGIADIDPEGLAQMGEGIDLDANEAAHESIASQRDRMPGR